MCYDQSCLGYLLSFTAAAFTILIYFSLKGRKKFLEQNLRLTAGQVWQSSVKRSNQARFKFSDLLFSIQQDGSASSVFFVVKNFKNEIMGRIECTMGSREYKIWIGTELYRVNFLTSGWRSAELTSDTSSSVLAAYKMINVFGKSELNIPGYGRLSSERSNLSWRAVFFFRFNKNVLGLKQRISFTREIGNLIVLPPEIPLQIRIFILAI